MLFSSLKLPAISRKSLYEAVFTISGRFVSIFLVIGTTKFLTTFLSEADYGQLALYNITATLPSIFFFGPLGQGILRLFPMAQEKGEINAFHHAFHRLYLIGSSIFLIGSFIGSVLCWIFGIYNWSIALLLIAGISTINSYNSFRYGLQNSIRKRGLSMGLETGDRLLQQVLAILFLWFFLKNPLVVLSGYLVSSLFFLFINRHFYQQSFPEIIQNKNDKERRNYQKRIFDYSSPFAFFGMITWFQTASDRWVLELLRTTEQVGQYAVINQIGFQSLSMLFGSISYFLFPILFSKAGSLQDQSQFENANKVNNWYLWLNIIITICLAFTFYIFGEEVIRLLSDEKYENLACFLPWMAISGGLFNFGQSYSNRFMLSMQTSLLPYPKIITTIIAVILNFAFVKYLGLTGLVTSICLTQFFYVIILIIIWEYKGKNKIQFNN